MLYKRQNGSMTALIRAHQMSVSHGLEPIMERRVSLRQFQEDRPSTRSIMGTKDASRARSSTSRYNLSKSQPSQPLTV